MPHGLLKKLRYGAVALLASTIVVSSHAAENATIRFAMTEAPPLAIAASDATSGMKGLYPDILDDILTKRMGLQWTGTFFPWKRAQLAVQTGAADVFITASSEERKAYAIPSSRSVFEEFLHVYTYKDHPRIREIREIKTAEDIRRLGLVPATNLGNNWHQENIDAKGIKTHYVPADENLARFLAARRADIMIDTPSTMDPKIDSLGLTQQIEKTPVKFGPIGIYLLVGKKSSLSSSMNALDQAVEEFIRDGTRERLAAEHLGTDAR
jgi:polar amino acid transport system substrate-binding protein